MWLLWRERNMRAFEGVDYDFVPAWCMSLFVNNFWCTLELPVSIWLEVFHREPYCWLGSLLFVYRVFPHKATTSITYYSIKKRKRTKRVRWTLLLTMLSLPLSQNQPYNSLVGFLMGDILFVVLFINLLVIFLLLVQIPSSQTLLDFSHFSFYSTKFLVI